MAVILRSGATTDELTIDPTSKAARITLYDTLGVNRGAKRTYRAATAAAFTAAAAVDVPWFIIQGSATTIIRVQRISVSGLIGTLGIAKINLRKYSSAPSGGTSANLTQVPVDSNSAAATLNELKQYTAVPTAGNLVGNIGSKGGLIKATTVADGSFFFEVTWDFRVLGESEPPVLRGIAQGLGLVWSTAAAAAVLLQLEIEWTEE